MPMRRAFIYTIYSMLSLAAIIILSPYFLYLLFQGRKDEIKERLGFAEFAGPKKLKGSQVVWLHGSSVGELKAAGEVMREMKKRADANYYFLVTAMTPTGRKLAREELKGADHICYVPADFPPLVYIFLRRLQPDILLLLETELWPGLIRESVRRGARVAVFNGRISNDSFSRYRSLKYLFSPFLGLISRFYMQSERDCSRINELGVDEEKIKRSGNIKFAGALAEAEDTESSFELAGERSVIVAGSTHSPEEKILLRIFRKIKEGQTAKPPLLILAPRHVERRDELISLIESKDLKWQQRSQGDLRVADETEIFLLDTIGELMEAYQQADVAFVGGTLADVGGHNFLEPLALKTPVVLGPNTYEIEGELEEFENADRNSSINFVSDEAELESRLKKLLKYDCKNGSAHETMQRESRRVKEQIEDLFSLLPFNRKNKKILFIRLSALGDVIHTLPAFSLLARKRPEYELHWLVEPLAAPIVENNRYVDKTRVLPRNKLRGSESLRGINRIKELRRFLGDLDTPDYDLSLDIHGILKSALPLKFAHGDISYGRCDGGEGSRLFYRRYLRFFREVEIRHKVEENLELMASVLGCNVPEGKNVEYGLETPPNWWRDVPAELREISGIPAAAGDDPALKCVGIVHPLSSWMSKNWLMERYRILIKKLLHEGLGIILSGSPDQRSRLEGIVKSIQEEDYPGKLFNAAGTIDLIQLYGILNEVDFFLGADTGPMHLAAAAETCVAAIMGPTDPEVYGPYCEISSVIRIEELDCLACGSKGCPAGHHRCMQELTVERVYQELSDLLQKGGADKNVCK